MSIKEFNIKKYLIECDICECGETVTSAEFGVRDYETAFKHFDSIGWTIGRDIDKRDLCPICSKKIIKRE